jgi:hypothetical protein
MGPCLPVVGTNVSENYSIYHQGGNNQRIADLVTLMMEAVRSSEGWSLTRATQRNIPEDGILHSHRRENLKSYSLNWLCSVAKM